MSGNKRRGRAPRLSRQLNIAAFVGTLTMLAGLDVPPNQAMAHRAGPQTGINPFAIAQMSISALSASNLPIPPRPKAETPAAAKPLHLLNQPAEISQPKKSKPVEAKKSLRFGLFGSLEFVTNKRLGDDPWRRVLAQLDNEQPLYLLCDSGVLRCPPRYLSWRNALAELRALPQAAQLHFLNNQINRLISYASDRAVYGREDHWASPMQFLQSGGDCEDYTILKYASLLELGYRDEQMRIVVVRDLKKQRDHAVLAVATDVGPVILDSLLDQPVVHDAIDHYQPVYSLNRNGRWMHVATKQITNLYAKRVAKRPVLLN